VQSEQADTWGTTSKWEQALQRLEITAEQRLVIDNAKAKQADDWSLDEADLMIRVSREARRLQAVDEYKALPRDDREREHQRVWQLIGGYTAFIAAACLAVISASKSEGRGVSEFLCKRVGHQLMEMRSPNWMVKRVSAAFQSRMGMVHFWLMLRRAR